MCAREIKEENIIIIKDEILKEYEPYKNDMHLARVVKVNKELYDLYFDEEVLKAKVSGRFNYIVSGTGDYPSVGDYVVFTKSNDLGIIHKVCSRFSELSRTSVGGTSDKQILAANVDVVFICVSLNNDFNLKKLNRFLSIVYGSKAKPIILLTKKDLVSNIDLQMNQVKAISEDLDVYPISAFENEDIDLIKILVKGKTCVFLGSSGVGKSTVVNKILGSDVLKTKDIRETDSQGRHTTAHRELFFIDNLDAAIIDTPGIRTIETFIVEDLDTHYSDISELSKQCKFSDCKHEKEPKCAVLKAIDEGELTIERFESYKKSLRINEYNIRREKVRQLKNKK